MTAYASAADVAARLGVAEETLNTAQVQAYLDDVSALVQAYTGVDFLNTVTYPNGVPLGIKWVTCNRVIRWLNNPDGITSETIGTYTYSLAGGDTLREQGWTTEEMTVLEAYGDTPAMRRLNSWNIGYTQVQTNYNRITEDGVAGYGNQ